MRPCACQDMRLMRREFQAENTSISNRRRTLKSDSKKKPKPKRLNDLFNFGIFDPNWHFAEGSNIFRTRTVLDTAMNEVHFYFPSSSASRVCGSVCICGSLKATLEETELIHHCNVEILENWIHCMYHVGSSHDCKSLLQSSLIAGG